MNKVSKYIWIAFGIILILSVVLTSININTVINDFHKVTEKMTIDDYRKFMGIIETQQQLQQSDNDKFVPILKDNRYIFSSTGAIVNSKLIDGFIYKNAIKGYYDYDFIYLKFDLGEIYGFGTVPNMELIKGESYTVTWSHPYVFGEINRLTAETKENTFGNFIYIDSITKGTR